MDLIKQKGCFKFELEEGVFNFKRQAQKNDLEIKCIFLNFQNLQLILIIVNIFLIFLFAVLKMEPRVFFYQNFSKL